MLEGFHQIDDPSDRTFERNLPALMGLLVVAITTSSTPRRLWSCLRAVLEAITGVFAAAHDGEQREARTLDGSKVEYHTGAVYSGEPGTKG